MGILLSTNRIPSPFSVLMCPLCFWPVDEVSHRLAEIVHGGCACSPAQRGKGSMTLLVDSIQDLRPGAPKWFLGSIGSGHGGNVGKEKGQIYGDKFETPVLKEVCFSVAVVCKGPGMP